MCGIFFSLARAFELCPDDLVKRELVARGPDSYKQLHTTVPATSRDIVLTFVSSVLALRGDYVQEQPLHEPSSGSVLCWNGEAWKVDGAAVQGNDSARIFDLLVRASHSGGQNHQQRIVQVLSAIAGPFAFVFYDAPNSTVYYGRDQLGRRSLLIARGTDDSLTLCSAFTNPMEVRDAEVSTSAVHFFSLDNGQIEFGELPWLNKLPIINKAQPSCHLEPTPSADSVNNFLKHLKSALTTRVVNIPSHSRIQMESGSAKVAVLFSGGLDCTLLARLMHEVLSKEEAVDLLNVAFENPRSIAAMANATESVYEQCPDRMTGRSSFAELRQVCPDRQWRFVAINVPYTESQAHKATIQRLMHPHNTEMDLSIAMALYFAARGTGSLSEAPQLPVTKTEHVTSQARVLLSGLGADELYGGYSRHAAAFARGAFTDLAGELGLDFDRIGTRNLGRDDRVMSHWGKEVRYPYLDEDLVNFSLALPVWEKCGYRVGKRIPKHHEQVGRANKPEDLEPAKMLLRMAAWELGMRTAASERKRAIQFGAKTAKMDIGKGRRKGTDVLVAAS
jgi:asparagine synthetase B (glutamine-hydrolysing)